MNNQSKRVQLLDILRGFALLGIFVVNVPFFAQSIWVAIQHGWQDDIPNALASWLRMFAFESKFYVLFSFLFGYGLAVQILSAQERQQELGPRYARRLAGLFVFGAIHAVFFFIGDILVSWAILGSVLWFLRNKTPGQLVRFAVGAMVVAVGCHFALGLSAEAATDPTGQLAEQARQGYLGSFLDAARQRCRDLAFVYLFTPLFNWPTAIALFALGLAAGKSGLLNDPGRFTSAVRPFVPRLAVFAVIGNVVYACLGSRTDLPPITSALVMTLETLAAPALTFCYLCLVARYAARLHWLAAPGRLSLTNYLGQALIASAIFCGWGLGWFGQASPLICLLLPFPIWAAQVLFSHVWLRHFTMGLDEWLLRCWMYLEAVPLLRPKSNS